MPPLGRPRRDPWAALTDLPAGFIVGQRPNSGYYVAEDIARIDLREGYTAYYPYSVHSGVRLYADRVEALRKWAKDAGLHLMAEHRSSRITLETTEGVVTMVYRPAKTWIVSPTPESLTVNYGGTLFDEEVPDEVECVHCGETHKPFTFVCPTANKALYCPACDRRNVTVGLGWTSRPRRAVYWCSECGGTCGESGCEAVINPSWEYCDAHAEHRACVGCATSLEWRPNHESHTERDITQFGDNYVCSDCAPYACVGCFSVLHDHTLRAVDGAYNDAPVCGNCRRNTLRHTSEDFDVDAAERVGALLTLPGREVIRKVGIEIEGAEGTHNGNVLARDFYNLGLSRVHTQASHNSGTGLGFAHVENDSSVDWEAVIGPVNMTDEAEVEKLNLAVSAIREHVHGGRLKLDLRCGLHIHVGAEAVGLPQAYNLSHLFTYLEDPIFRIGAAKWAAHRACRGSDYCLPIPKYTRKTEFFLRSGSTARSNHYYALSFQNYIAQATRNCACGAVGAGFWDECTCPNLGKCTFEFRLFNTTANPRKLFAYIALCQALVAKAVDMPEIKDPDTSFPGMAFNRQPVKSVGNLDELIDLWRPRLRYIFTELPLTEDEKSALRYCVRNSELAGPLNEGELNDLMETKEVVGA